jgi:hypothetical protein
MGCGQLRKLQDLAMEIVRSFGFRANPAPRASSRLASIFGLLLACSLFGASLVVAQPTPESSVLEGRVGPAAEMLKDDPRLAHLSESKRRDAIQFVVGNLLFVMMHEIGHVLISEMGLPVLGREEDSADTFAAVSMIWMRNAFSERVLAEAAKGWFYSDRRDRLRSVPVVYYDEHSLDRQRAYQIVCLMVGSDSTKFAGLAEETSLPEYRQKTCEADFSNAEWSWQRVLKDHWRTTQQITPIAVRHGEPGERLQFFARIVESIGLLEVLAQRLSDKFAWRAPFAIEAKACGRSGAEWNIATRTMTLCYELAEEFALLYCASELQTISRAPD